MDRGHSRPIWYSNLLLEFFAGHKRGLSENQICFYELKQLLLGSTSVLFWDPFTLRGTVTNHRRIFVSGERWHELTFDMHCVWRSTLHCCGIGAASAEE